jgi:alpha-maltose-1-phosphate synthase
VRVLIPITLDRWRHSIATGLRETCIRIPDISFYSFSHPLYEEDRILGEGIWARPNMHCVNPFTAFRWSFNVVHHASATNRNITAALLARARSLGHCCHLYTASVQPFRQDPWYRHYRFCVQWAHKLTAVSRTVADSVKKEFGRSVDAVILNGVDINFFSPEAARPVDFDGFKIKKPFLIFAGHLEARKRPDVFVKLSELLPDLDFVMLGGYSNTEERDFYLALMRNRPNVKYLGLQNRSVLRDLYANALALIFPSEIEGLALAVLEAQAMGLPVIAQPKTSMSEIVFDGTTGWLLPVGELNLWAKKIQELVAWSESERKAYALRSREATARRHSWDLIAQQYREIYSVASRS